LLTYFLLRRQLPPPVKIAKAEFRTNEWMRVAWPLFIMTAFELLLVRTDSLMLGWLVDAERAGIYLIAGNVATLVIFGQFAIGDIAAPLISELHANNRRRELQRLVTLAARGSLVFALPAAAFFIVCGKWVLAIWKPEFADGQGALSILVIGAVGSALVGPAGALLTMTGRQREATMVIGVSAVLNVALNALFIPRWGMSGAAWATTITSLLRSAVMAGLAWKLLRISPTIIGPASVRRAPDEPTDKKP
jgi:O-antigen/teichoic acid export membrane protein